MSNIALRFSYKLIYLHLYICTYSIRRLDCTKISEDSENKPYLNPTCMYINVGTPYNFEGIGFDVREGKLHVLTVGAYVGVNKLNGLDKMSFCNLKRIEI